MARQEITARLAELLPPAEIGPRERLLRADALSTRRNRTPTQVREVARRLAISERQLRNLFADGVGVSLPAPSTTPASTVCTMS